MQNFPTPAQALHSIRETALWYPSATNSLWLTLPSAPSACSRRACLGLAEAARHAVAGVSREPSRRTAHTQQRAANVSPAGKVPSGDRSDPTEPAGETTHQKSSACAAAGQEEFSLSCKGSRAQRIPPSPPRERVALTLAKPACCATTRQKSSACAAAGQEEFSLSCKGSRAQRIPPSPPRERVALTLAKPACCATTRQKSSACAGCAGRQNVVYCYKATDNRHKKGPLHPREWQGP